MQYFTILVTIILILFLSGTPLIVDAHPHATIDLMESHSHNVDDGNFQEEFVLHDFEHVIISMWEYFTDIFS